MYHGFNVQCGNCKWFNFFYNSKKEICNNEKCCHHKQKMKKTNCCYRFEPKEYLFIKDQLNKQFGKERLKNE